MQYFQFNTHNVYLQEAYGDRVEFPDKDNKFDIENYVEGHNFTVNGSRIPTSNVGQWKTPNTHFTPSPFSSTPMSSRVPRGVPLATLKVVRANLGSNAKSTNMNYCSLTAHMNTHIEKKACITNIQLQVWEEMTHNKLVILEKMILLSLIKKQPEVNQNI